MLCSECKNASHIGCVHKSVDVANLLCEVSGLSWKCNDCVKSCLTVNQESLKTLVDNQVQAALATLTTVFDGLKNDLIRLVSDKLGSTNVKSFVAPVKYASVVKNNTQPAILVKPKNASQTNDATKQAMLNHIDPVESSLRLTKVKPINNGGILVSCKNPEDNKKFKELAEGKLADSYDIKECHGIIPRVRVVGFTELYNKVDLQSVLRQLNTDIFLDDSVCDIININKTKKNPDRFQAVLQLDRDTYDRIIRVGNVFVGYDPCTVFDGVQVNRCFKCSGFNHSAKSCSNSFCCPRCGGDHMVKDCRARILCCPNCVKVNNGGHGNPVSTEHAAWDINKCTVYKNACARLRANILGQ